MAIEIIPINGKCPYFDYSYFENTVKYILEYQLNNTCKNIKIYLFNNFPVAITTSIQIDLVLIIIVENEQGNFYVAKKRADGRNIYFYNQIIPIKFISEYENSNIKYRDDYGFYTENEFVDYFEEIEDMQMGLKVYLEKLKEFDEPLYINPLIFIKNNRLGERNIIVDNYLVAGSFDFRHLNEYFWKNKQEIFISSRKWKDFKTSLINLGVQKIVDKVSQDSKYGYLTKKKIELLDSQYNNIKSLPNEINNFLVSIEGKAGTGKSSRLLSIAQNHLKNRNNILFLTYNKLLVYDISLLIRSILNSKGEKTVYGLAGVSTLHGFFYKLCKKLKITLIMGYSRTNELLEILKRRIDKIYPILKSCPYSEERDMLAYIQNFNLLDKGEKEEAMSFLKFLHKERISVESMTNEIIENYISYKKKLIEKEVNNQIFLKDYENVLRNLYVAIHSPTDFYNAFDVANKLDLFTEGYINKNESKQDTNIVTEKGFRELVDKNIGTRKRKRTVFIDEAQDCYSIEKNILIKIFGANNIVIANGGREQLIRYNEICNWEVFENKKIEIKKHILRAKSFRTKKTIIDFCNFIARKSGIALALQSMDSEDEGEIIFDFSKNTDVLNLFNTLKIKGERNGCKPYESILTLITPHSEIGIGSLNSEIRINENNVIVENYNSRKVGDWEYLKLLEDNNFLCYNGTRSKAPITSFDDIRVIHYESCRGLESWSVCCFKLDSFFVEKYNRDDAENYLLDKFLNDFNEVMDANKRKLMYATNWLLMPLTRAMDTLYIQIDDEYSYLGSVILEYVDKNKNNQNIKIIK